MKNIHFIDLQKQQSILRDRIDTAIKRVLDKGDYIMGSDVFSLEQELGVFCGAQHVISCANGTDALGMFLMTKNVSPGDCVFVPAFTFAATAEVVSWMRATPFFVDVIESTFNMDPSSLEEAIAVSKSLGLNPVGIIPVDLFGQSADYDRILPIADQNNLWVLSDAAQSFGGKYKGKKVGTMGEATATSFFPAKPLGCYGDGGAIFTNDDRIASLLKSIRVHGMGDHKYQNVRIGLNGRLDTLQAAILREKLSIFEEEIIKRNKIASNYHEGLLDDKVVLPTIMEGIQSVWAQYTVRVDENKREKIIALLKEQGIPTMIYYPHPLHHQKAYEGYPRASSLDVSEKLARSVLSLPMHPYLMDEDQNFIIENFLSVLKRA